MREILLPAHRLLHASDDPNHVAHRLVVPSPLYDTLRATLVQAELILLRVLGFELHIPLPSDYLPRYLDRALESTTSAAEDYDSWPSEERDEYGVLHNMMDTEVGRACKTSTISA